MLYIHGRLPKRLCLKVAALRQNVHAQKPKAAACMWAAAKIQNPGAGLGCPERSCSSRYSEITESDASHDNWVF